MAIEPIKKAKNGTYYFRVHLGFDSTGKRIQKYCSGYKTKKEARDKYFELILQKEKNLTEEKPNLSFKEYISDIFLPWYKTQVKKQTYDNRIATIKLHFSYFDNLSVDEIEPMHVQKWQLELFGRLKPSYVRLVQGMFSMSMDRAVVLGLTEQNPSKIIGNVKKQKIQIDFWTKDEFEKVLSVIDLSDYYQFFLYMSLWILFISGMRVGEATALQWTDLDFETGILNISKTLLYKNQKEFEFGEPKTKAGTRQIVLDKVTLELLSRWHDMQMMVIENEKFVLSYNGIPTQKHTLSHAIKRYAKAAGVHSIRTHDLRHSHASLLIALGENPLVIRDRLGHEDIETTLGTYGHLYPNTNFDVASKLNGILNVTTAPVTKVAVNRNQFTVEIPKNVQ
jgi:integrase